MNYPEEEEKIITIKKSLYNLLFNIFCKINEDLQILNWDFKKIKLEGMKKKCTRRKIVVCRKLTTQQLKDGKIGEKLKLNNTIKTKVKHGHITIKRLVVNPRTKKVYARLLSKKEAKKKK